MDTEGMNMSDEQNTQCEQPTMQSVIKYLKNIKSTFNANFRLLSILITCIVVVGAIVPLYSSGVIIK